MIFHWNGTEWTPTDTGDAGLQDLEVTEENTDGLTVGGGGVVYDLTAGEWNRESTPTGENLKAVAIGSPDIAVGASGIVIER